MDDNNGGSVEWVVKKIFVDGRPAETVKDGFTRYSDAYAWAVKETLKQHGVVGFTYYVTKKEIPSH